MLSSTSVAISLSVSSAAIAVDGVDGSPMSPVVPAHGGLWVSPGSGGGQGDVCVSPEKAGMPSMSVNASTLVSLRSVFMFFSWLVDIWVHNEPLSKNLGPSADLR